VPRREPELAVTGLSQHEIEGCPSRTCVTTCEGFRAAKAPAGDAVKAGCKRPKNQQGPSSSSAGPGCRPARTAREHEQAAGQVAATAKQTRSSHVHAGIRRSAARDVAQNRRQQPQVSHPQAPSPNMRRRPRLPKPKRARAASRAAQTPIVIKATGQIPGSPGEATGPETTASPGKGVSKARHAPHPGKPPGAPTQTREKQVRISKEPLQCKRRASVPGSKSMVITV